MLRFPFLNRVLQRMPARCRPALYFETLSSIGTGAFMTMFALSLVVLETILEAPLWHMALLATLFFGSSLFSPAVAYAGRTIPMRLLVIVPNLLVAALLALTALPGSGSLGFTLFVGASFLVRVFPRVAEMNMFRALYPATHRGTAVGWTRAVAALSGLTVTLLSWWWFDFRPEWYAALYCLVAGLLVSAAFFYARIPVPRRDMFRREEHRPPLPAFRAGLRVLWDDPRFLQYQAGFALAGIANFIGLMLVPRVLHDYVQADRTTVTFLVAVMPVLLMIVSAPLWGRYLDRRNPMFARGLFNVLQLGAFCLYAAGGVTRQVWPFFAGAALHALGNGGGRINWLTGSLYFARSEHVSLYNGLHVFLTGFRGLLGPPLGFFLFIESETVGNVTLQGLGLQAWIFAVSAGLSLAGAAVMFYLHLTEPASRETGAEVSAEPLS